MRIKIKFYVYFILAITLPLLGLWLFYYNPIFIIIPILLFIVLYYKVHKDFLAPLSNISTQIAKHQVQKSHSFSGVANAIDTLVNENQYLYDDMELMLDKQVQRLSQKTASLEILYNIVAKLNKIDNTQELFKQFLQVFMDMSSAHSGMVREFVDGKMRLAYQINASIADIQILDTTPCLEADGVQFSTLACTSCMKNQQNIGTFFIPITHNDKKLGAFALFFKDEPSLAYDERLLMQAIADNVALYLDKLNEQERIKNAEITKEKLHISQEIHDSLAQTIYSINLQISVLQGVSQDANLQEKLTKLQTNIKQANNELRGLIDNFRTPESSTNNHKKLLKLVENFENETHIKTYIKFDNIHLTEKMQAQILRIISEALANIKKHSKAKNVRIIYSNKQLLIEDDGIGFYETTQEGHIGLQVMRERAERIGAKLMIESEEGDGTIIILNYENKTN